MRAFQHKAAVIAAALAVFSLAFFRNPERHAPTGDNVIIAPADGKVKVRWFVIPPKPPGVSNEALAAAARERFATFDAADHLTDGPGDNRAGARAAIGQNRTLGLSQCVRHCAD